MLREEMPTTIDSALKRTERSAKPPPLDLPFDCSHDSNCNKIAAINASDNLSFFPSWLTSTNLQIQVNNFRRKSSATEVAVNSVFTQSKTVSDFALLRKNQCVYLSVVIQKLNSVTILER